MRDVTPEQHDPILKSLYDQHYFFGICTEQCKLNDVSAFHNASDNTRNRAFQFVMQHCCVTSGKEKVAFRNSRASFRTGHNLGGVGGGGEGGMAKIIRKILRD